MRAFILDGARAAAEHPADLAAALATVLAARGYTVETVAVRDARIAPCAACGGCGFRTPGECVIDDDGRTVARLAVQADLWAIVTAVAFGGPSAMAKKALERTLPDVHPLFERRGGEMHHRLRYPRPPFMLFLGWQETADDGDAAVFADFAARHALNWGAAHRALVVPGRPGGGLERILHAQVDTLEVPA